jgi:MYXO-CTERM domain-containing protein
MRNSSILMSGAVAAVLGVAGSATASWTKTYDFNDASSWTNGTGNSIGGSGLWSSSGFGGGLFPRSFNSGATSAYEAGAMRMTVTGGGYGGGRLYLNGSGSQTTAQVRQEFVDAMHRQWAPETSVNVNSSGTGVVAFMSYAVPVGGNPLVGGASNASASIGITIDFSQQMVFLSAPPSVARTSGGFALQSGWNSLKIGLTSAGIINYYLNSTLIGSASGTYDYLANAADGAINFYGDTYFSPGYATPTGNVSALFDDLVVSSSIPAPGALALLGAAGLVGSRRRRN